MSSALIVTLAVLGFLVLLAIVAAVFLLVRGDEEGAESHSLAKKAPPARESPRTKKTPHKAPPRQKAATSTPSRSSAKPPPRRAVTATTFALRDGGWAKVIAAGDDRLGQIGVVDALLDEGDGIDVFLRFRDAADLHAYRRDEVIAVVGPPPTTSAPKPKARRSQTHAQSVPPPGSSHRPGQQPPARKANGGKSVQTTKAGSSKTARSDPGKSTAAAPSTAQSPPVAIPGPTTPPPRVPNAAQTKRPLSSARNPARKPTSYWRDLPVVGKVALFAIPVVALVGIIAAVIGFGSRNEGSYAPAHADDQDDMFVEMLEQKYGIIMDSDAAVDMAKVACEAPMAGVGLYNTQRALQQRYPENSLNTVATVMSAGVLAYCPERLP